MTSILQCPVCRDLLLLSADGYQCSNRHAFDAAREGYVNLLLSHRKRSKEPGDSPDMVRSRRRFLDLGLYDKISDGLNEAVVGISTGSNNGSTFNILDAGCGEGFYLARLKESLALRPGGPGPSDYYGVDIAKYAVRQAAKRDKMIDWFVASTVDLPFMPASLDIVLNIFSPSHVAEFSRTLRDTGHLVIVGPGPRHLNGLREIIYPIAREHAPSATIEQAKGLFSLASEARITYRIELKSAEAIRDLLAMTPYFWNINVQTKSNVDALDRLDTDVDVSIRVFKKT